MSCNLSCGKSVNKKTACVGIKVADVIVGPVVSYPEEGILELANSIAMHNGGNAMTVAINLKNK